METGISIYEPLDYILTIKGTDEKEHVFEGRHDGEDDSWYGFTTTDAKGEEVAFTVNVFGGTSYGDTDCDIYINAYQCTTRSKDSKSGWCNDGWIELSGQTFEVMPIKKIGG